MNYYVNPSIESDRNFSFNAEQTLWTNSEKIAPQIMQSSDESRMKIIRTDKSNILGAQYQIWKYKITVKYELNMGMFPTGEWKLCYQWRWCQLFQLYGSAPHLPRHWETGESWVSSEILWLWGVELRSHSIHHILVWMDLPRVVGKSERWVLIKFFRR